MSRILCCSYASHTVQRLDLVLARILPHISRSKLLRYCTRISVNDIPVKFSHKLQYQDCIKAFIETPLTFDSQNSVYEVPLDSFFAQRIQESIIYRDEGLIVLNKQRGDVVHIGSGHNNSTIAQAVFHMLSSYKENHAREGRAGIVHRLDKDTSGILLIAKTVDAHNFYAQKFAHRAVKKTYLSIVKGSPPLAESEVVTYIARHTKNRKKFCNYTDASVGKEARSHYTVLNSNGKYSLVRWNILTGRTHQIRLHAQYIGTPILGDPLYSRAVPDSDLRYASLMLHAWKLEIALYNTKCSAEKKEFCAALPQDMVGICEKFFLVDFTSMH